MNHKPNVFSAPGTPLLQRTVGELVAERPGRSRIFQSFKIDFCCQGARTLREACEGKNIALSAVVEQLEAELTDKTAPAHNPADLPLDELAGYIVETHHAFLRRELPRLHVMTERVAKVHGPHAPSLVELFDTFVGVEEELTSHMAKEEQILFPAVVALSKGTAALRSLEGPIAQMIHEHETVGAALERMRYLTDGFVPPPEACNTYRALFAGLQEFEEDLHRHIHLENAVLFPGAKALAEKL
ncbi:MAG: iron-sulfur cluster repair di-iron protein [Verrucomicrobia bacterium]|nr:iron-sulfur cluster repair di-iron protein [Verrucomicrobiota bacterium]